jgi:hypothetical protein
MRSGSSFASGGTLEERGCGVSSRPSAWKTASRSSARRTGIGTIQGSGPQLSRSPRRRLRLAAGRGEEDERGRPVHLRERRAHLGGGHRLVREHHVRTQRREGLLHLGRARARGDLQAEGGDLRGDRFARALARAQDDRDVLAEVRGIVDGEIRQRAREEREVERGALGLLALGPHAAAHALGEGAADREAEAGAAEAARRGGVDLRERLEQARGDPPGCRCRCRGPSSGCACRRRSSTTLAGSASISTWTLPAQVNLIAFETRFTRICRTRPASP